MYSKHVERAINQSRAEDIKDLSNEPDAWRIKRTGMWLHNYGVGVSFMEKKKCMYQLLNQPDKVWVKNVLLSLSFLEKRLPPWLKS